MLYFYPSSKLHDQLALKLSAIFWNNGARDTKTADYIFLEEFFHIFVFDIGALSPPIY